MTEKYTTSYAKQEKSRKGKPWRAVLKYKDNGKWRETSKMLPGVNGSREAERLAEDWRREMNALAAQEAKPSDKKTIDEVVVGYLDYQLSMGEIEKSTYYTEMKYYNKVIKPYLGNFIFDELDRTAIIAWHTTLSGLGYKQSSIRRAYVVINKVYNYYFDIGEINKNPFKQVRAVRAKGEDVKTTHLTQEQMEKVLRCIFSEYEPDSPYYAAFILAFYSGMRLSEILGLRFNDIDFNTNTISVSSAIGRAKGGCYTKGPKNRSSVRTFPMMPQLTRCLKLRYEAINPKPNWFVCGYKDKFISVGHMSYVARKFFDAYDLVDAYGKRLTLGSLRHNFATVGMRADMDIAALSLMMGHANRARTLNVYGDANKQSKELAVKRLSNIFSKETDDVDYYPPEEVE